MKGKKQQKLQETIEYRRQAFLKKIDEYEAMSLEELKARFQLPGKKNRIGGIYKEAMVEVVRRKQIEEANKLLAEKPEEQPVVDIPHTETPTP